jgi:hypothetical protein
MKELGYEGWRDNTSMVIDGEQKPSSLEGIWRRV